MKKQIVAILVAIAVIASLLTVSVLSEEAYKPIIQSVTVSPTEIVNGGEVTLTIIAKSNAPVNWLNSRLDGPNGNIYGGGSGVRFINLNDDLWKYERTYTISEWAPSGTYTYSRISVRNEGRLTSDEWEDISFTVTNDCQAEKPILQSVTVSPTEIVNSGEVTLTIIAKSNAPVDWFNYRLDGPNGNIYGGGSGVKFINLGDDLWKHEWTYTISEWASIGTYTYSHISVKNEGQLTSDEWPPISFNVTRTPVTPTPPEEEGFGGYRVTPCDAIDISLENVTVTDFLNATNMTTVQVYNFKGYKGENCWMVQWSSATKSLNVYVNVTTGEIVGIEEQTYQGPSPTPTPETKTWHSVITFSGSEDKTTPPFTIKGDEWRVNWTVNSSSKYPRLSVFVYPRGETVNYVSHWGCSKAYYSDTQYIYEGSGDYYFDVGAANLDSWKLEVEDYY